MSDKSSAQVIFYKFCVIYPSSSLDESGSF